MTAAGAPSATTDVSTSKLGNADAELVGMLQVGFHDPRVALGLEAFRIASLRVPAPTVTYQPVTYSTTSSPA